MTTDLLDELIRSSLNDPLGEEAAPPWPARPRPARVAKRRTWAIRSLAIAALATVGAGIALFVPGRHPSLLENAAAALRGIGNGPVLHLVYASPPLHPSVLDLATGTVSRPALSTSHEVWYDRSSRIFRDVERVGSLTYVAWRSPTEALSSRDGKRPLSWIQVPPEVSLFSDYQRAIAKRKATVVGQGTIYGHQVVYLQIYKCVLTPMPGHPGSSLGCGHGSVNERIAIDRKTYLPVAAYPYGLQRPVHVLQVELLPRSAADLAKPVVAPPAARDRSGQFKVAASIRISLRQAETWLGRAPAGLRPRLAGLPLSSAFGDRLNPAGSPRRNGLELVYGRSCDGKPRYRGGYVLVQESTRPEPVYNTSPITIPGDVLFGKAESSYPECAVPPQDRDGFGHPRPDRVWGGALEVDGLYVSVFSPRRALALQAIRDLVGRRGG